MCQNLQNIKDIIKQHKESCLGLFQSQASQLAQSWFFYGRQPLPECMKVYLPKEGEEVDLEEVNTEFPTFNKLIQELVMIQKLLSKALKGKHCMLLKRSPSRFYISLFNLGLI